MEAKNQTVYSAMSGILFRMENLRDTPSFKRDLAELRHTVGKPLEEATDAWAILFENLPEKMISTWKNPSYEEKAIYNTLQLYALHQQGQADNVNLSEAEVWENIGSSLKNLRTKDNTKSIDRRFNALVTSTNFEELVYHLRQLIKLLKSRTESKVNYSRLASDLFNILRGYDSDVKLRWAREYYRTNQKEKDKNEK